MEDIKDNAPLVQDYYVGNTRIIVSLDKVIKTKKETLEILERVGRIVSEDILHRKS